MDSRESQLYIPTPCANRKPDEQAVAWVIPVLPKRHFATK